jgi:hypothetical protein
MASSSKHCQAEDLTSRLIFVALIVECRAGASSPPNARRPFGGCCADPSLRARALGYTQLRQDGDRSAPHSIDEQTSGFEPDRMQRSEKSSKDSGSSQGEIRWFRDGYVTNRVTPGAIQKKRTVVIQ